MRVGGERVAQHQVHGLADEDVAKAPAAAEVLAKFAAWVGDAPVVAHNVAFDLPFVLRHMPDAIGWKRGSHSVTLECKITRTLVAARRRCS